MDLARNLETRPSNSIFNLQTFLLVFVSIKDQTSCSQLTCLESEITYDGKQGRKKILARSEWVPLPKHNANFVSSTDEGEETTYNTRSGRPKNLGLLTLIVSTRELTISFFLPSNDYPDYMGVGFLFSK